MRLLASTLLVLLAAIYLHPEGVQADTKDVSNEVAGPITTSVVGDISEAALAQMLYRFNPIRMAVPDPVAAVGADEQFLYDDDDKPATNIFGSNNYCLDVKDNRYHNGNPIILWECGNAKRNQLWTFKSNGTIQSNGKCLTTSGYTAGNNIMIFDCDTAVPEATQWILSKFGTITNPISGLVISAENGTQGAVVTIAKDNQSSRQAWSARNYTEPTIKYLRGFRGMCLEANVAKGTVWILNCVYRTRPIQQWAVYGDSTIRLFNTRSLCLTSNGHASMARIGVDRCSGLEDQRWFYTADRTILNPISQQVMAVKNGDLSLKQIVLFKPTGNASQKWGIVSS